MDIFFVDQLPDATGGIYAHYWHRKATGAQWVYCDVREYINKAQKQWLSDVYDWHAELSKVSLKYNEWWWLFNTSTLHHWWPSALKPFFFALALIKLCEADNVETIYLVQAPEDVAIYIKELKPESRILHASDNGVVLLHKEPSALASAKWFIKKHLKILMNFLNNARFLFRSLVRCRLKPRKKKEQQDIYKIFICANIINAEDVLARGDYFFKDMFEELNGVSPDEALWVYFSYSMRDREKFDQFMRSKGRKYIILEDMLTTVDIVKTLLICLRIMASFRKLKRNLPVLEIDGRRSKAYPETYYFDSMRLEFPVSSFVWYFAMKNLLNSYATRAMIYPYEENGYERGILRACAVRNSSIRTIGYCQSLDPKRIYQRSNHVQDIPRPDFVAVTGVPQKEWFENSAKVRSSRIAVVGYGRYPASAVTSVRDRGSRTALKVLFLTGFSWELNMLANYLQESEGLFENCEVLIRLKKFAIQHQTDQVIESLKKTSSAIRIEEGSLEDQIKWCDVALYCMTTAGIDAVLAGRLSVYADLNDVISMEPLYNEDDRKKLMRCYSSHQLKETLERIRKMKSDDYQRALMEQRAVAVKNFSPINMEGIVQIVNKTGEKDGSRTVEKIR